MTTTIQPRICTLDRTGDYDAFVVDLGARLKHTPGPGEVYIVLHADETKNLFVGRDYSNKTYQIFVNPTTVKNMEKFVSNAPASAPGVEQHKEMLTVLSGFCKTKGHWILWEDPKTCLVIPHPTINKSQGSKEKMKRMKRMGFA